MSVKMYLTMRTKSDSTPTSHRMIKNLTKSKQWIYQKHMHVANKWLCAKTLLVPGKVKYLVF